MRIAAGFLVAGSLCAPGIAWAQSAPPLAAPPTAAAASAQAQPARAPCNNPDALGVARTVEIDTTGGPGFGFEHFKELDFLKDHEVVLTFDDGPWTENNPAILKALAEQCTHGIVFE